MSDHGQYQCFYCGRNDFKSARGYQQHLLRAQSCRERHEAAISFHSNTIQRQQLQRTSEILSQELRRTTRSQSAALLQAHDAEAVRPTNTTESLVGVEQRILGLVWSLHLFLCSPLQLSAPLQRSWCFYSLKSERVLAQTVAACSRRIASSGACLHCVGKV